jgi:hypothetical protein
MRDVCSHTTTWLRLLGITSLVPLAVPVAVSTAPAASAPALASTSAAASTAPLFRPVAALAVNRTVSARLKGDCGRLTTTGANHGGAGAHAAAPAAKTAIVLSVGWSMAPAPSRALLGLAARFAASGRRVAAFLKELLLSGGEDKFLTAVATRK